VSGAEQKQAKPLLTFDHYIQIVASTTVGFTVSLECNDR
jgi:hypothetical protein